MVKKCLEKSGCFPFALDIVNVMVDCRFTPGRALHVCLCAPRGLGGQMLGMSPYKVQLFLHAICLHIVAAQPLETAQARQHEQCRMPVTTVQCWCMCSTLKVHAQCAHGTCMFLGTQVTK